MPIKFLFLIIQVNLSKNNNVASFNNYRNFETNSWFLPIDFWFESDIGYFSTCQLAFDTTIRRNQVTLILTGGDVSYVLMDE